MTRHDNFFVPNKPTFFPLILALVGGGSGVAYGVAHQISQGSSSIGSHSSSGGQHPPARGISNAAPPPAGNGPGAGAPGGQQGATAPERKTIMIKMDPLVANLDEGDQLRYLKLSIQIEVAIEAQQRAQAALPRARHESLMYMSGLHVSDVQGLLGKQRIHRELQRRIADSIGGGLKRIYFDEFVVQ